MALPPQSLSGTVALAHGQQREVAHAESYEQQFALCPSSRMKSCSLGMPLEVGTVLTPRVCVTTAASPNGDCVRK